MSGTCKWVCPDCETAVVQSLFGTPHTSAMHCIGCSTEMEPRGEYDDRRQAMNNGNDNRND